VTPTASQLLGITASLNLTSLHLPTVPVLGVLFHDRSSVRAGPAVYRCCDDALGAWFDEYDSHLMPAFSRFFELGREGDAVHVLP
jgi:hypothetical protein